MESLRTDPGSADARAMGCTCDPQPGPAFVVEKCCPVHGLAELNAMLNKEAPDA